MEIVFSQPCAVPELRIERARIEEAILSLERVGYEVHAPQGAFPKYAANARVYVQSGKIRRIFAKICGARKWGRMVGNALRAKRINNPPVVSKRKGRLSIGCGLIVGPTVTAKLPWSLRS